MRETSTAEQEQSMRLDLKNAPTVPSIDRRSRIISAVFDD